MITTHLPETVVEFPVALYKTCPHLRHTSLPSKGVCSFAIQRSSVVQQEVVQEAVALQAVKVGGEDGSQESSQGR